MKLDTETILDTIQRVKVRDSAKDYQNAILSSLRNAGFECKKEFKVDSRGTKDGRGGRVDLAIEIGEFRIGIEIDRRSPRVKSLYKLRHGPFDKTILVLREPFDECPTSLEGIDHILWME